jgi:hypothetical protein
VSSPAPDPFLLLGSIAIGLGVGGLAWVQEPAGWRRGWGKFLALLILVIGIGLGVMYLVQVERERLADSVLPPSIALALLIWGLLNPVVGRRLARIIAVPCLAAGAGLLALGISALVLERPPIEDPNVPGPFHETFFTLGLGVAALVGGLLALGLSLGRIPGKAWEEKKI